LTARFPIDNGGMLDFADPPDFTPVYLNPETGEVQSQP